jgi:acid stress-induced BolA-like protein IbaG/YrbA
MDIIAQEVESRIKSHFWEDVWIDFKDERGDGKHFFISIISDVFEWKNRVERSQLVYEILWDLLKKDHIHAIRMKLKTPSEITKG